MKLRIGSRESELAVLQSRIVIGQLLTADPTLEPELVTMKTTGDKILHMTLDKIGGKGLFVKELDQALLEGRVDMTVHSLKDLPMEENPSLPIVAYTRRADPRDVLVLPSGVTELDPDKPIGSSSARRAVQLRTIFPHMQVAPVRGNVQTRLRRLEGGEFSALVLAAAGLERLGLEARISRYFTVEELLPAAGQGVLAVQTRGDFDRSLLLAVNDPTAEVCARAERAFVRALNGGCSAPVAAYATVEEGTLTLRGLYVGHEPSDLRRGSITGTVGEAETLGLTLAARLKEGTV